MAEDLCGIFVKSVIEGSMADRSGCIMCNDQITEVDGAPLLGVSNAEAVEMLKRTGNPVRLAIVRYLRCACHEPESAHKIIDVSNEENV